MKFFDYNSAIEEEYLDSDYSVFWGYGDSKLFEFSKEKFLEISNNDEPFNFTLLTVNTHATDGYLKEQCDTQCNTQLENVISCSDKVVFEFVKWIQKQDFYKDTTFYKNLNLYVEGNKN